MRNTADFDPVSYMMGQKAAGGGGGGSSMLAGMTDVDISNPTDGQTLVYNGTSGKWENGSGSGGLTVLQGTYDDEQEQVTLEVTCSELYSMCQDRVVGVQHERHIEYEPGDEEDQTNLCLISQAMMAVGTISGTNYTFALGEANANGGANDIVVFTYGK